MRSKKKTVILVVVLLVLILLVCSFGFYLVYTNTSFFHKTTKATQKVSEKLDVRKEDVDYEAKLFMVGDALIHSTVYMDARQADSSYDFKPMLQFIKPISSKYDLAYYNQETVLGGTDLGLSNYPMFNSPQEVGDAFIDAGFDMVSLATNHTMDKGEEGVLRSVDYWKRHPEIAVSGQWSSYEDRASSVASIYEVNHIKYAFLSYTIWNNGLSTPYGKDYLNNEYSPEKAQADIAAVRDKVDFVIVAMHWGTEYALYVDYKQEEIANYLSSLGVDLIIGAHPHVVQPVEYINDGKTFVIYSLGNFISDQQDIERFTGLAMEVTLRKHVGKEGETSHSVVDPKAELIYTVTSSNGMWDTNFRVKPYPLLQDNELRNHLYYYERYKAVVNERYPNLTWGLTWE